MIVKTKTKPKQNQGGGGGRRPRDTEITHTRLKTKVGKIAKASIPHSAKIPVTYLQMGSLNVRTHSSNTISTTQKTTKLRKITLFLAAFLVHSLF